MVSPERRAGRSLSAMVPAGAPATEIIFLTDFTPLTLRAIETALAASCLLLASPPNSTTPSIVFTSILSALISLSLANSALTLVVITESSIGCEERRAGLAGRSLAVSTPDAVSLGDAGLAEGGGLSAL